MSRIALMLSFVSVVLLACGGGGGGSTPPPTGNGNGNMMMMDDDDDMTMLADPLVFARTDRPFEIVIDITGDSPELRLIDVIDGMDGEDTLVIGTATADGTTTTGIVESILFSNTDPTGGNVHLQNVEIITIDGGMVNGAIDASMASAGVTFNLMSGMVGGDVTGSGQADTFNLNSGTIMGSITGGDSDDIFNIESDITGGSPDLALVGIIDGGGGTDELRLNAGAVVRSIRYNSDDPGDGLGDVHLQSIETITVNGGTVYGEIDASTVSSAVTFNLMSGMVTGNVNGGTAADTFNLNSGTITRNVNGGDGDDMFVIGSARISVIGTIDGGAGMNTLMLGPDFPTLAPQQPANFINGLLTLTLENGDSVTFSLANIDTLPMFTPSLSEQLPSLTVDTAPSSTGDDDTFTIANNIVGVNLGGDPVAHILGSLIDGGDGTDTLVVGTATAEDSTTTTGIVKSISFIRLSRSDAPVGGSGDVHLQNIEIITIDGGTVNGGVTAFGEPIGIDAFDAAAAVTFNLISGTINPTMGASYGAVRGSSRDDTFNIQGDMVADADDDATNGIRAALTVGVINGVSGVDELHLDTDGVVASIAFAETTFGADRGILFIPPPTGGHVRLANIETITIDGGTVNANIDASAAGNPVTFNLGSGMVGGDLIGSDENDIFNLNGGMVTGNVNGGAAVDTFNLNGGTITGNVDGGAGDDSFVIGGSVTVSGMIDGGDGGDTVSLADGFTPASVNLFENVLTLTLMGDSEVTFTLANIEDANVMIPILTEAELLTFDAPDDNPNTFMIAHNIVSDMPDRVLERVLNRVIDGAGEMDELQLNTGAVVGSISFSENAPTGRTGNVHLQNVETITIDGGTVNGNIDASMASAAVTFNLTSGTVGAVTGSDNVDSFVIGSGITVTGMIDGGGNEADTLSLALDFTPASANLHSNVLSLVFGGRNLVFTLANIDMNMVLSDFSNLTRLMRLTFPAATTGNDVFLIANDIVGATTPTHILDSVIDGGSDDSLTMPNMGDELQLDTNAVVGNILFSSDAPSGNGDVHLQNVEVITMNDGNGMVNGNIDASAAFDPDATLTSFQRVTFNLNGGTVGGDVIGSRSVDTFTVDGSTITGNVNGGAGSDVFNLRGGMIMGNVDGGAESDVFNLFAVAGDGNPSASGINIGGYLDGGTGNDDLLVYMGAVTGTRFDTVINGLDDTTPTPTGAIDDDLGDVRNFDRQTTPSSSGAGTSLSVRGIERLALSPALNLYGALSDALMQFGQQTAEGFALADMNPQTGRLTQLISKDSRFTKGRIWAHKITHSGNGKGSIGLNLTGLTARAASDYDYEMSLTQHGFDAPVVSSQWGDFGLRAVSHTMTGTIETNIAEAKVSGYGAGLAWLWRGDHLSANLTTLAGAYEVDAHTSLSNPQAIVNEVSEGSFSAINAVISAGIADKRKLAYGLVMRTTADVSWQTLSLDDFAETGADGIVINFDKATRFTARVGAGLEGEHWFSDLAFVHQTSSGGTLSSGLSQDYRQDDGTAIEMKFGGKVADLASGLTLKAFATWRQSVSGLAGEPSAQFELSYRF